MLKRITLAETLTHIFGKLEQNIPNPNNGISLLQAWTDTLGRPDCNALDVVVSIGQVYSALIKLECQVKSSKKLRDVHKNAAIQTISGFKVLFELQRFHEQAFHFGGNCQAINRGQLGLIGHSLESEFNEPRLEKPDADDLAAALSEVRTLLNDSSIDLDLRFSLLRHIDAMM